MTATQDAIDKVQAMIDACPKHRLYPLSDGIKTTRLKCVECPYTEEVTS